MTTLELDVHISADGVPMVKHDRTYAEKVIVTLDRTQMPDLPTLTDVIDLIASRGADEVGLNIETKFDVVHPDEEAPRARFAEIVVGTLRDADLCQRASVQSFDWTVLALVRDEDPRLALNALTNTSYLEAHQPGRSPWLAGLDIDDFAGSAVAAASRLGFDAVSPSQAIVTPALVHEAHEAEMRVIPYTVDDPAQMTHLIDLNVDGLISNRPDLLRTVLSGLGIPLPRRYPAAK